MAPSYSLFLPVAYCVHCCSLELIVAHLGTFCQVHLGTFCPIFKAAHYISLWIHVFYYRLQWLHRIIMTHCDSFFCLLWLIMYHIWLIIAYCNTVCLSEAHCRSFFALLCLIVAYWLILAHWESLRVILANYWLLVAHCGSLWLILVDFGSLQFIVAHCELFWLIKANHGFL